MFLVFLNKLKEIITKKQVIIFFIFIFSFYFNNFYSNFGVLPLDTFFHFDPAFRIINGSLPFRDFWIVSGLVPDLIEAFVFSFIDVSWNSHIIHSSIFNGIIAVSTFIFFDKVGLNKTYSFYYAILFSILAYPLSGTPFVDHHATFFCLLSMYSFIFALKTKKNFYWPITVLLIFLSFFSKQVPASYFAILLSLTTLCYCFFIENIKPLIYSAITIFFLIILTLLFLNIFKIEFNSFLIQYIFYPPSIGEERLQNFKDFSILGFLHEFKFVLIPLGIIIFLNIKKFYKTSNFLKSNEFYIFLALLIFSTSLLFHQTITKNQNLTYFLSIILLGYVHFYLSLNNYKYKSLIINTLIISSLLITLKVHFEYNEKRKFHDLKTVKFDNSKNASYIDPKLENLKWITRDYKNNPIKEMDFIKGTLKILDNDKRKKIVITNYLFFSALLNENLYSPSRSYTLDGASFPKENNKYFPYYKEFFKKNIIKNKIEVIYLIDLDPLFVSNYLDNNCISGRKTFDKINIFEINNNC